MAHETAGFDLLTFRGPASTVFTGRPQGEDARKKLNLDQTDKNDTVVRFRIPIDTTSITPSFFLGLLYDSIKRLGFDQYKSKYLFDLAGMDAERRQILTKDIEEGERNAINTIKGRRGLNIFLNNK